MTQRANRLHQLAAAGVAARLSGPPAARLARSRPCSPRRPPPHLPEADSRCSCRASARSQLQAALPLSLILLLQTPAARPRQLLEIASCRLLGAGALVLLCRAVQLSPAALLEWGLQLRRLLQLPVPRPWRRPNRQTQTALHLARCRRQHTACHAAPACSAVWHSRGPTWRFDKIGLSRILIRERS